MLSRLADAFRPSSILFFGPRASGNARPESDLDVTIVAEAFAETPFVRRVAYVLGPARLPKHLCCLSYTREEFARIKEPSSAVQSALQERAELTV